ncbi:hypothetical protein LCGC14_3110680 [marine sediment metagenome]|uniref:Uncharacterized protein n=1 Tax=marine sediment metagenome TaxID=412755 RepID=A0A0F8W5P7_9ZZZZ
MDNTQPDPGPDKMLFCNCAKCEGKKDEHYNDILDPEGECISRYCADIVFLEDHYDYVLHPEKRKTNADFDLSVLGPEEFFKKNHTPHTFEELADCF